MIGRYANPVRARLVATLSLLAFLAGPGIGAQAAQMTHGSGHGPATITIAHDDHRAQAAECCDDATGDESSAELADGCCHANPCSPGEVPPLADPSGTGFGAGRESARPVDLALLQGTHHVPLLRPPR